MPPDMKATTAKTARPQARGVLPRERLFQLLDDRRDASILWVNGPAGSGKTSLVASYIETRKLPTLWYRVDAGDADLATFFHYLGVAVKQAAPGRKKPLPCFTPEYFMGLPVFTRRFFEELYRRLPQTSLVVLDNFQDVLAGSGFHDMLVHGLEAVPPGVTVVIISRTEPPPQLARLRANGALRLIGWHDLRFTLEETREIVRTRASNRVAEDVDLSLKMQEMTKGWVVGLILLLEKAGESELDNALAGRIAELPTEGVFDYLAGEIFAKTTDSTRTFLLRTAFLPMMTAQMANQLVDIGNAGEVLADLNRGHFFTERHVGSAPVFRYHPLFRDFLLSRASCLLAAVELRSLQLAAARVLEEASYIEDAVELYIAADDWAGVIRLVCQQAQAMLTQGRWRSVMEWLLRIPQDVVDQAPWALFWLGTCQANSQVREGRQYLEKAFASFADQGDQVGIFLSWSAVVECFMLEWSDLKPLDQWIDRLYTHYDPSAGFPSIEIESRVVGSMVFVLTYRQPQHPELSTWKERLITLLANINNDKQRLMMGSRLLLYYMWEGEMAKATVLVEGLRNDAAKQPKASPSALIWQTFESIYLWHSGDFDACRRLVDDTINEAHANGVYILDHWLTPSGAYAALSTGDLTAGADYLRRIQAVTNPARTLDLSHYQYLMGWECQLRGDNARSLEYAVSARALADIAGSPFAKALTNIGLAYQLIAQGEYTQAQIYIEETHCLSHETRSAYLNFGALFALAHLEDKRGEQGQAMCFLKKALAIGRDQGLVNFPGWLPAIMARLCAKALESGIEVEYVQSLIRKRNLYPDKPPVDLENWHWLLKIYTLGRFVIVKDGVPLRFSGKVQQKPLALLKTLIALGGREVTTSLIIEALWPDADGDVAQISFKTTLHRLRQLLGNEQLILLSEGRITLNPRYCWVDATAFQNLSSRLKDIESQDGAPHELARLRNKIIKLYTGDFLPGETNDPWTIGLRERLKARVIRTIAAAGQALEGSGAWPEALAGYEKALEVNELHEEFYLRLMLCHQKRGQSAEALAVYLRCRRVLSAVLGIEPSPEIISLAQTLSNNR